MPRFERFQYRPLHGDLRGRTNPVAGPNDVADLRLLEILPETIHCPVDGQLICCRLVHENLFTYEDKTLQSLRKLEFTALSYTWGSTNKTRRIVVNGKEFWITENLFEALWHLRDARRVVCLWADAICINQDDMKEKAEQLRMMETIYLLATRVVCFLGRETEDFRLMLKFGSHLIETLDKLDPDRQISEEELTVIGLPPPSDLRWAALRRFLNRPWFTRKWIVQEFAFGNEVEMQCGDITFPSDWICRLVLEIFEKGLWNIKSSTDGHESLVMSSEHLFKTTFQCRFFIQQIMKARSSGGDATNPESEEGFTWGWLLYHTQTAQLTNPHDAIYSLLGIRHYIDRTYLPFSSYERPPEETFALCTAGMDWTKEKTINLLSIAGLPKRMANLHSWTPDWSYRSIRRPLDSGDWTGLYDASRAKVPEYQFSHDARTLSIQGNLIDTITQVTKPTWRKQESMSTADSQIFESILRLEKLTNHVDSYSTKENISDVYWKLLIGNRDESLKIAPDSYRGLYDEYRAYLAEKFDHSRNPLPGQPLSTFVTPKKFRPFAAAAARVCRGRKFCLTAKGYIGQVPSEAEAGDSVCIVKGESIPFVLSSVGSLWRLIGDAYIHGIMQGEALDWSGYKNEDIVLI